MKTESVDLPINGENEDRLGHISVARALASAIESQPNEVSFVLGLEGAGSSGKSGILNLVTEQIKRRNDESEKSGIGKITGRYSPLKSKAAIGGKEPVLTDTASGTNVGFKIASTKWELICGYYRAHPNSHMSELSFY
ncbi:MAG: hypothetical protein ABJH45_18815 [Paracoccaceae bacterium]